MVNGFAATRANIRYRLKVTDKTLSGLRRLSKLLLKVVVFRRDGRENKSQSAENTDYCKQCSPRVPGRRSQASRRTRGAMECDHRVYDSTRLGSARTNCERRVVLDLRGSLNFQATTVNCEVLGARGRFVKAERICIPLRNQR
jgi:hypothetical protein